MITVDLAESHTGAQCHRRSPSVARVTSTFTSVFKVECLVHKPIFWCVLFLFSFFFMVSTGFNNNTSSAVVVPRDVTLDQYPGF